MNFLKYNRIYSLISGALILISVMSLIIYGLKPSIDFTGGSLLEIGFTDRPPLDQIRQALPEEMESLIASLQTVDENQLIIKSPPIDQPQAEQILTQLQTNLGQELEFLRFETIGPTLGRELLIKTLIAIVAATGFITLYLAWTFKDIKFGLTAIAAMFHDTFILVGIFSLLGGLYNIEIDTLFVTAVLTTLSFSVHDTVVVYDRIREIRMLEPKLPFTAIANKALTETMTRSVNNSMTIIFMLTSLALLGGATIRYFIIALLFGTILGTYSSPFVAVPLLNFWQTRKPKTK